MGRPDGLGGHQSERVRSVDGSLLDCVTVGDGPPALAVHGLMVDVTALLPLLGELARTFTATAYSRRGSGRSEDRSGLTLDLEVADLASVASRGPGPPTIVGHSYGGAIALAGAQGCQATSVVVYEPAFLREPARRAASAAIALADEAQYRAAVQLTMREVFAAPSEIVAGIALMPDAWCERIGLRLARELAALDAAGVVDLGAIDLPVAVVVGGRSAAGNHEAAQEVVRALPRSELVVVADAGHDGVGEQPRALADLVAHWADRCRSGPGVAARAQGPVHERGEIRW